MNGLLWDLRFGLRLLAKSPGFTAVAILSLALGIGANTAIFSLIDAVLLKTLPVEAPERLAVFGAATRRGLSISTNPLSDIFSYPRYRDLRDGGEVFRGVAAFGTFDATAYVRTDNASPQAARVRLVSGNYFEVLGVRPFLGRLLAPADNETEGAHAVLVLSYGYWKRRFASDPAAPGKTLVVHDREYSVIGVTPPGFFGERRGNAPAMWAPLAMQAQLMRRPSLLEKRDTSFLGIIARLEPDVSLQQAAAATHLLWQQILLAEEGEELSDERRETLSRSVLTLTSGRRGLSDSSLRRFSQPLLVLMGFVAIVLLIACANVANLQLARGETRRREISVRLALGASRWRLVRQLITEGLLLAGAGGVLGLVFSVWGRNALLTLTFSGGGPLDVHTDGRVLAFTLAASLISGVLFGVAPALGAAGSGLERRLQAARGAVGRERRFGLRGGLVAAQAALSLVLLAGAMLFLRSLDNLRSQEMGFQSENVLLARLDPRGAGYRNEQLNGLNERILDSVRATPGVRAASLSMHSVLSGSRQSNTTEVFGYEPSEGEDTDVKNLSVTKDYFDTLGIAFIDGRGFTTQDREGAPLTAVVNRAFGRRYFKGGSAVGGRFSMKGRKGVEIVGVVEDVNAYSLRESPEPMIYHPARQMQDYLGSLAVRTVGDPAAAAEGVRRALQATAPDLPISNVVTLERRIEDNLRYEGLLMRLTGFFAGLALLLGAIGLYGVMSYAVARRTSEIGVRMALGAQRGNVLWHVLRESLLLIAVGTAAGLAVSFAAGRLLANMLFEVSPIDPAPLAAATLILGAAGTIAGYLPARRAARTNPMEALRYE